MSKSGQAFIAATEGHQFTLYAMMRAFGIPLTEEQEKFQAYLERTYPPIILNEEYDIVPFRIRMAGKEKEEPMATIQELSRELAERIGWELKPGSYRVWRHKNRYSFIDEYTYLNHPPDLVSSLDICFIKKFMEGKE